MKFLFYFFMVCAMAAVPSIVVGQLLCAVLKVSDDTGLFIGLFVFVGLVWQAFAGRKPTV